MSESTPFDSALTDPLPEEVEQLRFVLAKIRQQLGQDGAKILETETEEDTDEALTADEIADATVEALQAERRRGLRLAYREPYFGRLDFREMATDKIEQMYIGKRGVEHPDTADRLVLDWRSPAASMFYSFTGQGDDAAYDAPEGHIQGQVLLKRNIVVRDSELQRVVDSYVQGQDTNAVTDEFLIYRLAENKDSRLRDIVSTIQAEQNDIIRADKNRPVVIQGVAGSGKTTVALHRLAYLLYQHQDRLRADKMVIFAPTSMFVDYISEVLPELGVGGIQQTTFSAWALRILDFEVALHDQSHRLRDWFGLRAYEERSGAYADVETKGQLAFLEELETYVMEFEQQGIPSEDFNPVDGHVLTAETIANWFRFDYATYPLYRRQKRVLARVKRFMEIAVKESNEIDKKSVKRTATAKLRQYERLWPELNPLGIYRDFLNAHPILDASSIHEPKRRGARVEVQTEDLAPLLLIHRWLHGVDPRDGFDHVVIDEAQDFSPAQLAVLRGYCQSQSFTILGDLSQSIHTYQGITDWTAFIDQFPDGTCAYYQLDVSYRSTLEIIEFANQVIRSFGQMVKAKPVFRSGDPVQVENIPWPQRLERAVDTLNDIKSGVNTVALLTRTEEDAHVYHNACLEAGVDAHLIDSKQTEYLGGISVIPIYLAKGLEFDHVLIVDVDKQHYDESPLSAKLLYVGCTRALHKLRIHYTDGLTPLVANLTV